MPKIKNKSSAKKRFKITATGKVIGNSANRRHMMSNKTQKSKRQSRADKVLAKGDARLVTRNWLRT